MKTQIFLGKFGLKPDFLQKITSFVKEVNLTANQKYPDPFKIMESFIVNYTAENKDVRLLSQPPMVNFSDETISFVYETIIDRIVISKMTICGVIVIDPNNLDTCQKELDSTFLILK